jgi:ornithine cyclodeaminase
MVLFSTETGLIQAILLDNGYLTDVRTAAAGAVAARWLAPESVRVAGIIGAGVQARLQLRALSLVRPLEAAVVWARDAVRAGAYASEMTTELGLPVRALGSARAVVEAAEVIVTTTPATEPLLEADWLRPGQHVTAMGSDAEHKNELQPGVLARADVYVCDRRSQASRLGEWHHAIEVGVLATLAHQRARAAGAGTLFTA